MTKDEFKSRFNTALNEARDLTSAAYQLDLAPDTEIVLFGAGVSGVKMSPDEAAKRLYIDEQWFFKIIDVGVVEAHNDKTVVFVRPSNHTPCEIHKTWNQGEGCAPFKPTLGVLKGHKPPTA